MSTTWKKVSIDLSQQDQVQRTEDDRGKITETLIQTWVAETDHTSFGTTAEALTASDGTNTIPDNNAVIISGGRSYAVYDVRPLRSGPYTFSVQVTAESIIYPATIGGTGPTDKTSVSLSFSGVMSTQDCFFDKDGNPVADTALQPFDPPIKEEIWDEEIRITFESQTDQSATLAAIRGRVNDAGLSFTIQGVSRSYPYRGLKVTSATQSSTVPTGTSSPTRFFSVALVLLSRTDLWITTRYCQSLYVAELSGGIPTGKKLPALDKNLNPVTTPVFLDVNGQQCDPSSAASPAFKIEKEAGFAAAFTGLT